MQRALNSWDHNNGGPPGFTNGFDIGLSGLRLWALVCF